MVSVQVPAGIIRESVTDSASLLKDTITPVSSSPEANRRWGYSASSSSEKAVRLGRKVSLEPMTPYERRIIHATLADSTEVKTASEGKEPNRFIVVIPNNLKPGADRTDRRGGKLRFDRNGKGGFNRDRRDDKRGGKSGYDRDRKFGSRDDKPRASGLPRSKRQPYFGTFLGNSNDVKTDNEKPANDEE